MSDGHGVRLSARALLYRSPPSGGGLGRPVAAELIYLAADPFATVLSFAPHAGQPPWMVAREVARSGLEQTSGVGAIRVTPSENGRRVIFGRTAEHRGDDAAAGQVYWVAALRRFDLSRFLEATYRLVPENAEDRWLDVDALLKQLRPPPTDGTCA